MAPSHAPSSETRLSCYRFETALKGTAAGARLRESDRVRETARDGEIETSRERGCARDCSRKRESGCGSLIVTVRCPRWGVGKTPAKGWGTKPVKVWFGAGTAANRAAGVKRAAHSWPGSGE